MDVFWGLRGLQFLGHGGRRDGGEGSDEETGPEETGHNGPLLPLVAERRLTEGLVEIRRDRTVRVEPPPQEIQEGAAPQQQEHGGKGKLAPAELRCAAVLATLRGDGRGPGLAIRRDTQRLAGQRKEGKNAFRERGGRERKGRETRSSSIS